MSNNSGPTFSTSRRGGYARLVKQGVENAMGSKWLFGRRVGKPERPDRGAVIWPGPPTGKLAAYYRDMNYNRRRAV